MLAQSDRTIGRHVHLLSTAIEILTISSTFTVGVPGPE